MSPKVSFESWKDRLRNDCIAVTKLEAYNRMGDTLLRILYDSGLDPSVQAIVTNGLPGSNRTAATSQPLAPTPIPRSS